MAHLTPQSIIYLACPANYATGGTEVMHQLANKLNLFGRRAVMYYFNYKERNPVHPRFVQYQVPFVKKIDDLEQHLLVAPEGKTNLLGRFKSIQKAVWWLSIDFYFHTRDEKIFWFVRKKVYPIHDLAEMSKKFGVNYHFVQSHYAKEFLRKFNLPSEPLSDYLNRKFLSEVRTISYENRKNRILYNPKKGFEFTRKLMAYAPQLEWVALENLSVEGVADLLRSSKIYIDFGNHPGKDRFPREAAALGCIVFTNKQGAAGYQQDLPIPEDFKIEAEDVPLVISKIEYALSNYENLVTTFDSYRSFILAEEREFENQIKKIFNI